MKSKLEWITIKGFGLNRAVFIGGKPLDIEKSFGITKVTDKGFDWGYDGDGSRQLAVALLSIYLPKDEVLKTYKELSQVIISNLPQGNFQCRINIGLFLDLVLKKVTLEKNIHAFQFIEVFRFGRYISKLIDPISSPFLNSIFKHGTIEFDLLNNLPEDYFKGLQKWVNDHTKHKNASKETVNTSINKQKGGNTSSFIISGGLGTGTNYGLNKKDYGAY